MALKYKGRKPAEFVRPGDVVRVDEHSPHHKITEVIHVEQYVILYSGSPPKGFGGLVGGEDTIACYEEE